MNIIEIQKNFKTNKKCLDYLEKLRWPKVVTCTKCHSKEVIRLKNQQGRFHCYDCKTTFSVITDTIFEHTRLSLPKWFIIIGLMLNAKRGIAAKQIMRDVGLSYKTAWYIAMRVRCGMIDNCNILENIVEMDEAYVGGKPRKHYKQDDSEPNISKLTNKRGRGTKKTPIVGIVERNGKIVLRVIQKLNSQNLLSMLRENVKTDNSIVVTDEFKSYNSFDKIVQHYTVDHSKKQWVKGAMHTNTIEGFWSIVKGSIKGNYIALSRKYLPFYLVQAQYVFNFRNFKGNIFEKYLKEALQHDKPMEYYKPTKSVRSIVYNKCKTK
jgi:transposase-like protein